MPIQTLPLATLVRHYLHSLPHLAYRQRKFSTLTFTTAIRTRWARSGLSFLLSILPRWCFLVCSGIFSESRVCCEGNRNLGVLTQMGKPLSNPRRHSPATTLKRTRAKFQTSYQVLRTRLS